MLLSLKNFQNWINWTELECVGQISSLKIDAITRPENQHEMGGLIARINPPDRALET
jgi:hypothetical protein